jgi:S-DNA-T family DNA segregation ATPase FtsK/SpoIIIE
MTNKTTAKKKAPAKSGAKKPAEKAKNTAKGASAKKAPEKRTPRAGIEIFGIVLIALGALFAVYLYSGSDDWLGTIISHYLFGMHGCFAYAVPVMFVIVGIYLIVGGRKKPARSTLLTGLFAFWFVLCALHMWTSKTLYELKPFGASDMTFAGYLSQFFGQFPEAWLEGVNHHVGGGVLGMILPTLLYVIGGKLLCWVVIIAGFLISILLCTGISIKAYTDAFGTKVREKIAEREQDDEDDYEDYDNYDNPEEVKPAYRPWKKGFSTTIDEEETPQRKKPAPRKKPNQIPFDELFEVPEPDPEPSVRKRTPKQSTLSEFDLTGKDVRTDKKPEPVSFEDEEDELVITPVPVRKPAKKPSSISDLATEPPVPEQPKKTAEKPEKKQPAPADRDDGEDIPLVVPPAPEAPAYEPPSIDCLNKPRETFAKSAENPTAIAHLLEETLASFNISAKVINISVGPVVTRYELQPAPGVRVNRITTLSNDIALALAAPRVRIEAPIPGKAAVGIEVPNKDAATVLLRDIIDSEEFMNAKSPVTMALGKDIAGKIIVADLGKMPHMLIAGSTGSGKSVCINDLIISMIYKSSPQDLQLILVDPKMVELSVFGTLPHLLIPVVTEPKKAASALRWAVNEMTVRYKKFTEVGARELTRYNSLMDDPKKKIPKLVIIIDELADLMMVAPDDVEDSICRIAQLGRAAGIHLIVATQRPSADIITGLIKANIPSRCAFAVSSAIDSRIILDATGAEKLLGRGDMLFHPNGAGKPTRLQCAYVSDEEVERVMSGFKKNDAQFSEDVLNEINDEAKGGAQGGVFGEGKQEDDLLGEAVRVVMENGQASISMIQRRLRVGYARAARLVDMMEQKKYVSPFDGSKPRQVLITQAEFNRVFGGGAPVSDDEPVEPDETDFEEDTEA